MSQSTTFCMAKKVNWFSDFCNKLGSGKTTLVESVILRLREQHGIIYIKAEQTPNLKIFNQDMARAFDFNSFEKRLTDGSIIANLWSGAAAGASETLDDFVNILNHIELAAKKYQLHDDFIKPTLIIDHITYLVENNPQALKTLQAKAKYWADHNIMTVIFVGSDGLTPAVLSHESDSSRMEYVHLGGMDYVETVDYIMEEFLALKSKEESVLKEEKERINNATKNLVSYYKWNLAPKIANAPPLTENEILRKVFEHVVFTYVGGNFMDAMEFVDNCLEGQTMQEIEEYNE